MALAHAARRRITHAADRVLPSPPLAGRRAILCYHSVRPEPGPLSLSPRRFAEHLDWLAEHASVVSLDELLAGPRRAGGPYVAITFDDGYADNHRHALPLLSERGMAATFFVTAGFAERDDRVMARLERIWATPRAALEPLSWSQVRELRAAGMQVGSHTWSHPVLSSLAPAEAEDELRRSRAVIEERLGEPVRAVAYPWGKLNRHVDEATFAAAARAGYEHGMISLPRAVREDDGALRVPRLGVGDEPVARLAAKATGAIDWHGHVHERLPGPLARRIFADA